MKRKLLSGAVVTACAIAFVYTAYSGFIHRYFVLPKEDRTFLAAHPTREQVLEHFGMPFEELKSGERFQMRGWYPLPDRAASGAAFSFSRRYGSMLYVFFGHGGEMEHYVVSHS